MLLPEAKALDSRLRGNDELIRLMTHMPPLQAETTTFNHLPCARLSNAEGATALVALHGAHVLSWIPADGRERLFLGERAIYAEGAAIRGGVPVIFPQF